MKKEDKVIKVPGLKFFDSKPMEAWSMLQKFLNKKGNPPYIIKNNVYLNNLPVKTLDNLKTVNGDLLLKGTKIDDLGVLVYVEGNLDLRNTPIKSLGELYGVGKNLVLYNTPIQDLGKLKFVGGSVNSNRIDLRDLGNLEVVETDLDLYESKIEDFKN